MKYPQIASTIEQSRMLISAGLSIKSADMIYLERKIHLPGEEEMELPARLEICGIGNATEAEGHFVDNSWYRYTPAWSLSRLIDIHGDFNYGPMDNGSEKVIECIVNSIIHNIQYDSGRIKKEFLTKK